MDITPEQWVILEIIHNLGDKASQSEVTKLSYRNRATTSRLINSLCQKEFVSRSEFPGDSRRFKLNLSDQGMKMVKIGGPIVDHLRAQGFQGTNPVDYGQFESVLKKMIANYSKE